MTSKRKIPPVFFELLAHRERKSARSIAAATDRPERNEVLLRRESNHMKFIEDLVSIEGGKTSGHPQKSVKVFGSDFSTL